MATENYLQAILQIEEEGIPVTSTQLAGRLKRLPSGEGLGTSLPSVGGMIRRMVREGLAKQRPDKTVALTPAGRTSAEGMVRRHRLAERMVVDLLGMDLHVAHEEAHRLEHAISRELEERISATLGNPKTCPFGHPIPGSGYVTPKDLAPLSGALQGQRVIVERLPEDDRPLLEYFVASGLVPGESVVVVETAPYRGVIRLECNAKDLVVGYQVADRVWVRTVPE